MITGYPGIITPGVPFSMNRPQRGAGHKYGSPLGSVLNLKAVRAATRGGIRDISMVLGRFENRKGEKWPELPLSVPGWRD